MRRGILTCVGALVLLAVGVGGGMLLQKHLDSSHSALGPTAAPNDVELVQEGDLSHVNGTGTFDLFYKRPFASPPQLRIDNPKNSILSYKLNEQRADGFKIDVWGYGMPNPKNYVYPKWEAIGMSAGTAK